MAEIAFNEVNQGTSVESDNARLGFDDEFFVSDPITPTPEPSSAPTPEPTIAPTPEPDLEPTPGRVVISEIGIAGDMPDDEYVELYNAGETEVNLFGWSIQYRGGQGENYYKKNFPDGAKILPHKYYLIIHTGGYTDPEDSDMGWSQSLSGDGGTIFLANNAELLAAETDSGENIVDKLAYGIGEEGNLRPEGAAFVPAPRPYQALERKANAVSAAESMSQGGADEYLGNGWDSGDNSADFVLQNSANPQWSGSFYEPRYAPEKVSDFLVERKDGELSVIKISFTVPYGAFGNAQDITYNFRFSMSPITEQNFFSSSSAMFPSGKAIGQKYEGYMEFMPDKTYYFAIAAVDNTGLRSEITFLPDPLIIPSAQDISPWYAYKGNNARTGQSAHNGSQTGNLRWKYKTGNRTINNPSIDYAGNIYFWKGKEGDHRDLGSLVSMFPDMSVKWQVFSYSFENTPAINPYGNIIYYQDVFDSTRMGDILKFFRSGGMYIGGAKILYGAGSVQSDANSILSSRDGSIYFIASMANSKLIALEPILNVGSPQIKWKKLLGGFAAGTPAEDKDKNIYANAAIIIKNKNGAIDYEKSYYRLISFNSSGKIRWQKDLGEMKKNSSYAQFFTPVVSDGVGYINAGNSIYAFSLANGETQKIFSLEGESSEVYYVNSPSVAADGSIYISASDGYLYAIGSEGEMKWRKEIKGIIYRSTFIPSIGADGTIYIGGENTFYALNSADGSEKWQYSVAEDFPGEKAYAGVPAIAKDGTVYVSFASFGGKNGGQLYAFGE